MTQWVVDAHLSYQAGLNVPQLAREGFGGLIVKATEGDGRYRAPAGQLESWIGQAEANGMVAGTYHWLRNDSTSSAQLDYWLSRAGSLGGRLAALDIEDPNSPPSKTMVLNTIKGFMDRTGGHPLLVYSGMWWVTKYAYWLYDFDLRTLGPVFLWDSHYVSGSGYASTLASKIPNAWWGTRYGKLAPTLLQFSSSVTAGGKQVDASEFRGDAAGLRALAGVGTPATITNGTVNYREDIEMFFATDGKRPDIVLTDGVTWSLKEATAYTFEEIQAIEAQPGGFKRVTVDPARLDIILGLPEPATTRDVAQVISPADIASAIIRQLSSAS